MEKFFAAKNDDTFNARDFRPRFRKTDVVRSIFSSATWI